MTDPARTSAPPPAGRRRSDWVPTGLAIGVWVCTLPFVFLLVVPWLGVRGAVVMALMLLVVTGIACWALCAAGRVPSDPPPRRAEP